MPNPRYDFRIRPFARLIWEELWDRRDENNQIHISQLVLADLFGVTHNTVWNAIHDLTDAGYISRPAGYIPREARGVQTYTIICK